jgi:hypothetical protein
MEGLLLQGVWLALQLLVHIANLDPEKSILYKEVNKWEASVKRHLEQ